MRIAVIAMGKIGLPLAVQFASKGHEVIGVDVNPATVDLVNQGVEPFPGEADLGRLLSENVEAGRLRATTDYAAAIPNADAIVIVVPLFVNDETWEPDFTWMDAATASFAEHLSKDTLVIYETTLPVGTVRGRFAPMIEEISGLTEGRDFHAIFSPERVLTGRVFADLRKYPKLIGGLSQAGADRARTFYEAVLDFDERDDLPRPNGVWDLGSAEASEMAKLAETTYRDVNIGLANQFALYADRVGINVHAVIEASNSQPYSHIHRPGIFVGGHCIPVYPRLYLSGDPDATVVRSARLANASVPEVLVARASDLLGSLAGLNAVVLGASYRTGVKETAFSGVFPTVAALEAAGAKATVHDPLYSAEELAKLGLVAHVEGAATDLVIVQTDHPEYAEVGASDFPGVRLVIDGRRVTSAEKWTGTPRIVLGEGVATP
ncbi:nucleotide sugar dehydrogenase [Micrococcales bacterium 31B]|nr:nucleotide sugar dehydrogenase [Micrococcales bacterium 31B]